MPHCRVCKKEINKNKEKEGVDWIMPSKNWYYHVSCYEEWRKGSDDDEDWIGLIYDFIARDLKVSYDYHKCEAQRKKFIKENKCTNRGIFFTLKYFYELKHGDWNKGYEGIGIVPYVYREAVLYWQDIENKQKGVIDGIKKQLMERASRPVMKVDLSKSKNKSKWNLDDF